MRDLRSLISTLGGVLGAAGLVLAASAPAMAQTVGLGTTTAGATNQIATNIAAVVSSETPVQMRTQTLAGASQYIPLVNAGELDFGISNLVEATFAVSGEGWMMGRPNPNLKMVATLFPFRAGLVVPLSSGITSIADLAGKRVPSGFSGNPLGDSIFDGALKGAGLERSAVTQVPVPAFPRMFDAFDQGLIDVSIAAYGAGRLLEMDRAVGGLRYISMVNTPEGLAAFQSEMPGSSFVEMTPDMPNATGIIEPTYLFQYEYMLFAGANVSDEVVAHVARALYENRDKLVAAGPLWAEYDEKKLAQDVGLEFHDGARAFYESVGIWQR